MRYLGLCVFILLSKICLASDFATSEAWLAVGHYQDGVSSIDSANFFLSDEGKVNPESELLASIELFNGKDDKKKCLFPSRYLLLKKNALISDDFPDCDEYEQFKTDLQPSGERYYLLMHI